MANKKVLIGDLANLLDSARSQGLHRVAPSAGATVNSKVLCVDSPTALTGSRGDGTALVNLIAILVDAGVITDGTEA